MDSTNFKNMFKNGLYPKIPDAINLILCPFAGGSSSSFQNWFNSDFNDVNFFLATYPGREHRMREAFATDIKQLANDIVKNIYGDNLDLGNTILVGHSMGAQVAYETCLLLEKNNTPPAGIVISACHAPHLKGRRILSHLDDDEFVKQLIEIGGLSQELSEEKKLLNFFLPMLRSDFNITESYNNSISSITHKLTTPSLLMYGSSDNEVSKKEVSLWSEWLCKSSEPVGLSGEHFYITQDPKAFIDTINLYLRD